MQDGHDPRFYRSWRYRRVTRGALVVAAVLVALTAACGDGDGGRSMELDSMSVEVLDRVDPEGTVISVSPLGQALVSGRDSTCVVELDGREGPCVNLQLDQLEPVRWSPDGGRAASSASVRSRRMLLDADVSVLDVAAGTVSTVTDDGTDEASEGFVDLYPSWLDEDTVAFVRLTGGFAPDGRQRVQLATATSDAEGAGAAIDLEIGELGAWTVPFGDALLVHRVRDGRSELLAVDSTGETRVVLDFAGYGGIVGDSSVDRHAVAVPTADLQTGADARGPVAYLRVDDPPVLSDFDATAAVVSPDGDLVAAVASADPADGVLTIWDPVGGTAVELAEVHPTAAVTWTVDDRIVLWDRSGWQVIQLRTA